MSLASQVGALATRVATEIKAVKASIALKENSIAAGTTAQYYRGDKSWQTLSPTAVGLGLVPNTDATNMANAATGTLATARGGTGSAFGLANAYGVVSVGATGTSLNSTKAPNKGMVLMSDLQGGPEWMAPWFSLADIYDTWTILAVRVATTANIALSGTQTIDGVAVAVGNRVLVKNQTNAVQNGIYVVQAGAWWRDTLPYGATVPVDEGTQHGTKWQTDYAPSDTIDVTAINWGQILDTSLTKAIQVWTTANAIPNGTTPTTLTGSSITVNVPGSWASYTCTVMGDVTIGATATTNILELMVDGVARANGQIVTNGVNFRVGGLKTIEVTGLTAGNHTFSIQTRNTTASTAATVWSTHSGLHIARTA